MKLFILKDSYKEYRTVIAYLIAPTREEALHRLRATESEYVGITISDQKIIKQLLVQFVENRRYYEPEEGWNSYFNSGIVELYKEEEVEDFFLENFFTRHEPTFAEREASEEGQTVFPWMSPPAPRFCPWEYLYMDEVPLTVFDE